MSLFKSTKLSCPNCATESNAMIAGSINADRRPDLRDAILDNSFQDVTCSNCETQFRVEPRFNLLDIGHGQWIAAMPGRMMADFLVAEDSAIASFDGAYGPGAPDAAQQIGKDLDARLTFGWPAVREKLLVAKLGLDDVVVEQVKLDLLRRLPEAPLRPGVEIRLTALEDDRMTFLWIETQSEEMLERIEIDRALYDMIASDRDGWAENTAALTDGMFVDMQKLYMGIGREAAPVEGAA